MRNILLAVLLAATLPASAQDAQPLTQNEAIAFIKGKDLDGVNSRWTARFNFKEDGTLYGSGSAGQDKGTYTLEEGKLCLKWTQRWRDQCGQLVKAADGSIRQVLADGSVWITFKN